MDLVTWLRQQLDEDEAHARKDLDVVERASAGGNWEAWHGHNLTYSEIRADGALIGRMTAHMPGLPDGAEDQHGADLLLVARMVRWARRRANQALRDIEAKRRLLDEYAATRRLVLALKDGNAEDRKELRYRLYVVQILAAALSDRPGYREEWRP